jgi:hypothetical protein
MVKLNYNVLVGAINHSFQSVYFELTRDGNPHLAVNLNSLKGTLGNFGYEFNNEEFERLFGEFIEKNPSFSRDNENQDIIYKNPATMQKLEF